MGSRDNLFKIHDVRFYDLEPKAIHCMDYDPKTQLLALSRSDNSIEIWSMKNTPHVERCIPGSSEGSIEGLVWARGRLFSTGLHGFIVEYDLETLSPLASYAVTSGPAWCLGVNKQETLIAAGSEEGYVCLFEITDVGLVYHKVFDKQEGRILCLSWHSSGDFIITGSADAIRVWNVKTGHAVTRITPGRTEKKRETLVWCASVTDDFVIITGDSRGKTCFWDGKLGTLLDEMDAHKADVLCLTLSEDQQTVYCAGVDPAVVLFSRVVLSTGRKQWVRSVQRAIHTHDVRAMVLAGPKLISGGVDSYLTISSYPPKFLCKYAPLPQPPICDLARKEKLLLLRYSSWLEVWRLGSPAEQQAVQAGSYLSLAKEPVRLVQLHSKDDEAILCSAISETGKWLAYASDNRVWLYSLNMKENVPSLKRVRTLPEELECPQQMAFHGDDLLLLSSVKSPLQLLSLSESEPVVQNLATPDNMGIKDAVHLMAVSNDGHYVVISDHLSNTVVVDLKKLKVHSTLPRYQSNPTAMAVHPTTNDVIVAYADHKIVEYSINKREYTPFSRKLSSHLPSQWINRPSVVRHITFDPRLPDVIFLHDDSVICSIDKRKELAEPEAKVSRVDTEDSVDASSHSLSRTSAGTGTCTNHCFTFSKKYKHLAYLASIAAGEMVAVEVNPLALERHLPPALYKKRFGV